MQVDGDRNFATAIEAKADFDKTIKVNDARARTVLTAFLAECQTFGKGTARLRHPTRRRPRHRRSRRQRRRATAPWIHSRLPHLWRHCGLREESAGSCGLGDENARGGDPVASSARGEV